MRVVVVIMFLAAVAHADDDALDVPGRDATDLRGDAMVWEDAAFYLEPWDGGALIRFSSFGRARREEVGRAIPVKIISSAMRAFVEVEVVDGDACTSRRARLDERVSGMRLFVRRDDLAPVLVKPFTMKHPNGTRARIQPGVPVAPTVGGTYLLSARGDILRLAIPHASVGYTYTRGRAGVPAEPKGALWYLDRELAVKLGEDHFQARARWLAVKPAKRGDTVNLKWATRCIELVVNVPTKHLVKRTGLDFGGGLVADIGVSKLQHTIPRGTPLTSASGREIAVAARTIEVYPPANGKACFDATFTMLRLEDTQGHLQRMLRLCANADVVSGPPVDTVDPYAAPVDVGAAPSDAKRTAKGVFYKRLGTPRAGKKPSDDDTVVVHYTGWTADGKMFDSSLQRGQPARFPLRSLIAGWTDGLQVMSIGDKVRFWIPEQLAYKGSPGAPQGMLVFDVELLGID